MNGVRINVGSASPPLEPPQMSRRSYSSHLASPLLSVLPKRAAAAYSRIGAAGQGSSVAAVPQLTDLLAPRVRLYILLGLALLALLLWDTPIAGRNGASILSASETPRELFATLQTSACSAPSVAKGRPAVQYALMVDAGSTGSRIHIYKFHFCDGKTSPQLEDEIFRQVKPGLSSYENSPAEAARSLDVLLETALQFVPQKLQKCTPIAVKATAGLRKIGTEKSERILSAVKQRLQSKYPFKVMEKDGVVVMDGKDEGVYAWITVNYLLDNLGNANKSPTTAIMDLGGGSTQIVFEPSSAEMEPGDHKYKLTFGGHTYTLYQHSYLGYGLMEGRRKIKSSHIPPEYKNTPIEEEVDHPCLPVGFSESFESTLLMGAGKGFDACYKHLTTSDALFRKDSKECKVKPCSFDGVYQPPLMASFKYDIYAFSYFYDRTHDLKPSDALAVREIRELGEYVCSLPSTHDYIKDNPHFCVDLAYIYGLLVHGYEIDDARELKLAKKIKGFETGWCLGASQAMVEEYYGAGQITQCF